MKLGTVVWLLIIAVAAGFWVRGIWQTFRAKAPRAPTRGGGSPVTDPGNGRHQQDET
jgi:hypothetical protein